MRRTIVTTISWALTLICLSGVARAQVNMTITSAGSNTLSGLSGGGSGHYYDSPYIATVGTKTDVQIICDDFGQNSSVGPTWTAYAHSITTDSTFLSDAKFGMNNPLGGDYTTGPPPGGIATLQQYEAAAFLAQEISTQFNTAHPNNQSIADLQYALWTIFNSHVGTLDANAQTDYNNAIDGTYNLNQFADVIFLTPNPGNASQEFIEIVPTPEPVSLALFGTGLILIGLAVRRKQLA